MKMTTEKYDAIMAFVSSPDVAELFAEAISHGMHKPFAIDAQYWGKQYQERLLDLLDEQVGR